MRYLFFFSSRRRHTRLQGDWSSDVCSSDLTPSLTRVSIATGAICACAPPSPASRAEAKPEARGTRSEERRVGKGVDLGGRRIIKKKKKKSHSIHPHYESHLQTTLSDTARSI